MKICCIDNCLNERYATCVDELERLSVIGEFYDGNLHATDEEKIALALECEVVIFGATHLDNEILERLPNLRILQFLGTGVANYVDMDFCRERSIKVFNVEEYGNNAVAEYALAMILALIRNLPKSNARTKAGVWDYNGLEGIELQDSVVGVLGTGKIGAKVAQKLDALGVKKILGFDLYPNESLIQQHGVCYTDIEDIFSKSDILTIHLKLSAETEKLVSKQLIAKMKPNSYLINTARAELVDYKALLEAVRSKRIRGAAVDVYYEEPIADYEQLLDENIVATSHIGFFTANAKRNLLRNAVSNIINAVKELKLP